MATINRERASTILAEANCAQAKDVASRYGITVETIRNYRKLEASDAAFAKLVAKKTAHLGSEWRDVAIQFLRNGLRKLDKLVEEAKSQPGSIREVAGAIKIVGELHIVKAALSGEHSGDDLEGQEASEAEGRKRSSGQDEVH